MRIAKQVVHLYRVLIVVMATLSGERSQMRRLKVLSERLGSLMACSEVFPVFAEPACTFPVDGLREVRIIVGCTAG